MIPAGSNSNYRGLPPLFFGGQIMEVRHERFGRHCHKR